MVDIGGVIQGAVPKGSTVGLILLMFIGGLVVLLTIVPVAYFIWNKKRWNIKVEIKLPRSDGRIVNGEWGKGYFHSKRGVVYIKRPGFAQQKIPLKIFDPKRYLQGTDLLTVIQLSPSDYRPVLPESFLEYVVDYKDDITGEITKTKESILNIKCDTGHSKAWQVAWDAATKRAYSLQSFMNQFQTPISVAIVLVAVFIGFAAIWSQM